MTRRPDPVERRDLKETLRRILAFFADQPPRSG